jgi:hypothetical protein
MSFVRPAVARHPAAFGQMVRMQAEPTIAADLGVELKLFAATFLAGFLFVSILIG